MHGIISSGLYKTKQCLVEQIPLFYHIKCTILPKEEKM